MSLLGNIKTFVISIGNRGSAGKLLYYHIKYGAAKLLGRIWTEEHYAKWFYHLYTKKQLDLDQPKRFDEKLWWLKLYNRDPMLTQCSDKVTVREYVKACGCQDILIPQLACYQNVKELDLTIFQEEVVVKCNHNSGGHLFYDPQHPPSPKSLRTGIKKLKFILKQDASILSREWNYKNIPPRLIVEKVIRDHEGNLPLDYKFMCFDGIPKLLFLDLGVINPDGTYNHNYPRNIYDMDFNLLPVYETRPNADYPIQKPDHFDKMVEIARRLSEPFPFSRVDLYNIDGKIYFGEITFYHGGGCNDIQPEEWDLKMGEWIRLDNEKIKKAGAS